MRFIVLSGFAAVFLIGNPGAAQAQTVGACMLETAKGEPINIGPCEKFDAECSDGACRKPYFWHGDGFTTIIFGGNAEEVRTGTQMNGQDAYAPAALVDGDPRDCIYNEVTDGLFCFVPGAQAQALAVNNAAARASLIALAGGTFAATGGKGKKGSDAAPAPAPVSELMAEFQGKYRPIPQWDCGEIGRDGGALAVEGNQLLGLESACTLSDGQAVSGFGAVLFQASCTGEGEVWSDEILLDRDEWGSLAVLRETGVTVWELCPG